MGQTREEVAQHPAERSCWQAARRDDSWVARRLYNKQVVDGVYQLNEGTLLDYFFYFMQELGVGDWLGEVQGTAVQREMVPVLTRNSSAYLLRRQLAVRRLSAVLWWGGLPVGTGTDARPNIL
jgi:hypothetical protein